MQGPAQPTSPRPNPWRAWRRRLKSDLRVWLDLYPNRVLLIIIGASLVVPIGFDLAKHFFGPSKVKYYTEEDIHKHNAKVLEDLKKFDANSPTPTGKRLASSGYRGPL